MSVTTLDIENARFEYENTSISLTQLSAKYGEYPMFWSRKAKKEEWVKYSPPTKKDERNNITVSRYSGILDTIAVRKVKEIVEELGSHYNKVDEPHIVAYAKNYELFIKLSMEMDTDSIVLVSEKTGGEYMAPKFSAWLALGKNIASMGASLGITVTARKRLGVILGAEEKTESLFDFIDKISETDLDI